MHDVDETDIEILKILSEDSRKKLRPIAIDLNKSPTTVGKHIKDLEDKEIIKKYTINIDYEKLGYDIVALIELTISKGMMRSVEETIAADPNVFAVYDITGEYDAIILARFRTRHDLNAFVKNLNSHEFVVRTNTHLILNVIKDGTSLQELIESEKKSEQD